MPIQSLPAAVRLAAEINFFSSSSLHFIILSKLLTYSCQNLQEVYCFQKLKNCFPFKTFVIVICVQCLGTYIILMDISFLGKNPKKFNFSNFSLLLYYEDAIVYIQSYLNEIPHQCIVLLIYQQYGTKILYNGRLFEQYQSMTLFPKISLQAMLLHISSLGQAACAA